MHIPFLPSKLHGDSCIVQDPIAAAMSAQRIAVRCRDLGAATQHLALVASLSAGYAFSALVSSDWAPDPSPATIVRMLALAASLAMAAYVLTFTLLECHYTSITAHLVGALGESHKLTDRHLAHADRTIMPASAVSEHRWHQCGSQSGATPSDATCSGVK